MPSGFPLICLVLEEKNALLNIKTTNIPFDIAEPERANFWPSETD